MTCRQSHCIGKQWLIKAGIPILIHNRGSKAFLKCRSPLFSCPLHSLKHEVKVQSIPGRILQSVPRKLQLLEVVTEHHS